MHIVPGSEHYAIVSDASSLFHLSGLVHSIVVQIVGRNDVDAEMQYDDTPSSLQ